MASTGPLTCLSTVESLSALQRRLRTNRREERSDYQSKSLAAPQSRSCRSIAAEAAWRLDADEVVEIEIDDGLQSVAGGGVTQIVGQDVIPGGGLSLQGDQPGNGCVPALCTVAPVGWTPIADHRRWLLGLASRAITRLAFGVAERVLTFGLSAGLSTVM